MAYERYHWSYEDCVNLPLSHATYIPVVGAAIAEIHKEQERKHR